VARSPPLTTVSNGPSSSSFVRTASKAGRLPWMSETNATRRASGMFIRGSPRWVRASLPEASGALHGVAVRRGFQRVVERRERASALALQRRRQQPVGQMRVLGEQRAVHVAADGVAVARALQAVLPVVAMTNAHLAQRPGAWPQECQARVVLEAHQLAELVAVDHHVADETRRPRLAVDVERLDARQ